MFGQNQGVAGTASTVRSVQLDGAGGMNSGVDNAQAIGGKGAIPPQQAANRVGQRPKRFFQPHIIQAKDRYYESEKQDKHCQWGRRKKKPVQVHKVYRESAMWLEHAAILEKAGVNE